MIRRAFLCLALGSFVLAQAADRYIGGPYVVRDSSTSATVGWVVESAAGQLRAEKVSLQDLKPDMTVRVDVPKRLQDVEGAAPAQFKTAPVGRSSFEFVVFGDTRTRHDLHRRVIGAIEKTNPDFALHTGDLVQDGRESPLWSTFFDIEHDLLRKTAFYPALGNHERNSIQFRDFFSIGKPYYSFDWGAAHFSVINSDVANAAESAEEREAFWKEQRQWLENDLQCSQKADFRFVVMHHPPMTVNSDKGGHVSKETPLLIPVFEQYKVTAVLAGHDHNYQRHLKNGIQYIITGGGGAPLANAGIPIPDTTVKVESTEHYVTVKVEGRKAHARAVALDGHVIDEVDF
jgi:Icc-related predicted phosphoesterase